MIKVALSVAMRVTLQSNKLEYLVNIFRFISVMLYFISSRLWAENESFVSSCNHLSIFV